MPTGKFIPPASDSLAMVDCGIEGWSEAYGDHCVVIEGVVAPGGDSRLALGYDVYMFALAAWRHLGEPLVRRELTMLRPVAPSIGDQPRDDTVWEDLPEYSIQRFSVLLSKDQTRAVVEKVLPIKA